MNNIEDWLVLHRVSGVGPKAFQSLLSYFGSASKALEAATGASNDELSQAGINNRTINNLRKASIDNIQADLDWLAANDQHHIIP